MGGFLEALGGVIPDNPLVLGAVVVLALVAAWFAWRITTLALGVLFTVVIAGAAGLMCLALLLWMEWRERRQLRR